VTVAALASGSGGRGPERRSAGIEQREARPEPLVPLLAGRGLIALGELFRRRAALAPSNLGRQPTAPDLNIEVAGSRRTDFLLDLTWSSRYLAGSVKLSVRNSKVSALGRAESGNEPKAMLTCAALETGMHTQLP